MPRGRVSKPAFGTNIPLKDWHPIIHSKVGPILRAHRVLDWEGENFFPVYFHAVKSTGKAVCKVYNGKLGTQMRTQMGNILEHCEEEVAKLERDKDGWHIVGQPLFPEVAKKVLEKFTIQALLPS